MASLHVELEHKIDRLKRVYFSDKTRQISFKKGEVLAHQGEVNKRLYLILSGSVLGQRCPEDNFDCHISGVPYEIFRGSVGTFVGVQSFFSQVYRSFSEVTVVEDLNVAYIDTNTQAVEPEKYGSLVEQFVPTMVYELALRNSRLLEKAADKEAALHRLHRSEMTSTLGQLAAGLAHELNNAIGVISRKTDFVATFLEDTLKKQLPEEYDMFRSGEDYNAIFSSEAYRSLTRDFEKRYHISNSTAKILARIAPSVDEAEKLGKHFIKKLDTHAGYWELGHDIRDMRLAAKHATSIVKSIKILGGGNIKREDGVSIYESFSNAIALLKPNLRGIKLESDLDASENSPLIYADMSELTQIWVNIIKNSCDALAQAETVDPEVHLACVATATDVTVSITDNGPGVSDGFKEKIFNPDFTTKKNGLSFGLGLGLAIVKRIVDSYGGEIILDSQPGKTRFNIKLPIGNAYGNN